MDGQLLAAAVLMHTEEDTLCIYIYTYIYIYRYVDRIQTYSYRTMSIQNRNVNAG